MLAGGNELVKEIVLFPSKIVPVVTAVDWALSWEIVARSPLWARGGFSGAAALVRVSDDVGLVETRCEAESDLHREASAERNG